MMTRNNVSEGLAASELMYNNNLCLLCEAIELQQNTNNNICSDKNKRLDNKNNNTLVISTSTNSIKKEHVYKRKKPRIFEGCTSLRKELQSIVCVMAERSIDPADILAVAIVLRGKKDYVKNTTHNIQRHVLDIYSRHQVNCTCQSGHAFDCWICFNLSSIWDLTTTLPL